MPKATVSTETVRKDLHTLEGAFVELKRMSFGAKQSRTDIAMKMAFEGGGKKKATDARALMEMSSEAVALFDFKNCVVDHNLFADDAETIKLDLSRREDLARLDPRVGEEISTYIDELNNFSNVDMDDLGNGSNSQS